MKQDYRIILETLAGSHMYGTSLPSSDIDYRGIAIKVKPKPINLQWAWVCIKCETPIVVINGKYYYFCDCNKSLILSED